MTSPSLAAQTLSSSAGPRVVVPCRFQPSSPLRPLVRGSSEALLATAVKLSPLRMRAASPSAFFLAAPSASAEAPGSSLNSTWRSLRSLGAFS